MRLFRLLIISGFVLHFVVHPARSQSSQSAAISVNAGHSVNAIDFDPAGRWVTSAGTDSTVKLWDLATGRLLRTLGGSPPVLDAVAASRDGKLVAAKSRADVIKVWEAESGKLVSSFSAGTHGRLTFSRDGRHLFTGQDKTPKRFDIRTGKAVMAYPIPDNGELIFAMDVSADERLLLVGASGGRAYLYDVASGRKIRSWNAEAGKDLSTARFSPDGARVVTVGNDWKASSSLKVWDVGSGRLVREIRPSGQYLEKYMNVVAFSPDGGTLFAAGSNKTIQAWNIASGKLIWAVREKNKTEALGFSPDGRNLVSGGNGITFRDPASGQPVRHIGGPQHDFYSSAIALPDGRWLWSTSGTLNIMDISSGQLERRLTSQAGSRLSSLGINAVSGQLIVATTENDALRIWDVSTGQLLNTIKVPVERERITSIALSPDGAQVAATTRQMSVEWEKLGPLNQQIPIWDTASGRLLQTIQGHTFIALSVAFSPDGQVLASIGLEHGRRTTSLKLWAVNTGQLIRSINLEQSSYGVKFPRDGRLMFVGGVGLKLFNVATGEELRTFDKDYLAGGFNISPDGRWVAATRALTNFSDIWDAQSGIHKLDLQGSIGSGASLAFTGDSRRIVQALSNGALGFWSVETGELLGTTVLDGSGEWITITPEGFFAASQNGASLVHIVRGFETTDANQVYQALFRPDLVREKLAGDPKGLVKAAAAKLDLDKVIASGAAPEVRWLTRTDEVVNTDQITVEAEIVERGGGIGRAEWRVNGITLGVDQAGPSGGGKATISRMLTLEEGDNTIELVANNARNLIASPPARLQVRSDFAQWAPPRLYMLAVGINDYYDGRLRLNFPVADASSLARGLEAAGKDIYESISVKLVLDAEARRDGIDAAFTELSAKIRTRDVFVFFAAGHGKTADGRYYFIPQDFRYQSEASIAESGISQEQFQAWFARIRAKKSILLFDTCESGTLTKDGGATRGLELVASMERLTRATGRTVLSASTDDAPALEGYRGHGVFTYALLEALGKADADGNGLVDVTELASYVDAVVPELSFKAFKIRQIPQMKLIGSNFPLFRSIPVVQSTDEPILSRKPTHVTLRPIDIFLEPGVGTPKLKLAPGTTVSVVRTEQGWTLLGKDGVLLGYADANGLVPLQ